MAWSTHTEGEYEELLAAVFIHIFEAHLMMSSYYTYDGCEIKNNSQWGKLLFLTVVSFIFLDVRLYMPRNRQTKNSSWFEMKILEVEEEEKFAQFSMRCTDNGLSNFEKH